jgi:hypothetical protein
MSQYNNDLFLDPSTKQYGGHMIMSNVHKSEKTKLINIDTKFREEYNYLQTANYNISLPERITEVKSLTVTNVEIPISYYNISANLGNNTFTITNPSNNASKTLTIPDGQYSTGSQLQTAITNVIGTLSSPFTNLTYIYNPSGSIFKTNSGALNISFAVDPSGNIDKYNVKYKLGWLLGYRNVNYSITTSNTVSESFVDLNGPRYLYLALEEYNKGNQKSFITPLFNSMINKNIIARISMDPVSHGYQSILPANMFNGLLKSDNRNYTGKIDIQKLNVQLLNEIGNPINLNGMDFSFFMEVVHE